MITKRTERILDRFRVTSGKGFRLKDHDPGDTAGLDLEKDHAAELLQQGVERLAEPAKKRKFLANDVSERAHSDRYMTA